MREITSIEEWQKRLGIACVEDLKKLYKRARNSELPAIQYQTIDAKRRHWKQLSDLGLTCGIEDNNFVALSERGEDLARELLRKDEGGDVMEDVSWYATKMSGIIHTSRDGEKSLCGRDMVRPASEVDEILHKCKLCVKKLGSGETGPRFPSEMLPEPKTKEVESEDDSTVEESDQNEEIKKIVEELGNEDGKIVRERGKSNKGNISVIEKDGEKEEEMEEQRKEELEQYREVSSF